MTAIKLIDMVACLQFLIKQSSNLLPKDIVNFQRDEFGLGNLESDIGNGIEGIGIILL